MSVNGVSPLVLLLLQKNVFPNLSVILSLILSLFFFKLGPGVSQYQGQDRMVVTVDMIQWYFTEEICILQS